MNLKGTKTEANLMAAFAGESQARNKYTYYASKAKKDGYVQIAQIFEETANAEEIVGYYIMYHKDSALRDWLDNTKGIVSCTTRPPRDYEVDGVDYHFLTPDQFAEKVLDGSMLEAASFNGWFYGTAISELDADKMKCILDELSEFSYAGKDLQKEINKIDERLF